MLIISLYLLPLLVGAVSGIIFYRLKWLTSTGSLLMGMFLSITFYAHWAMFGLFLIGYVIAAIATVFRVKDKEIKFRHLQFPSPQRNAAQVLANTILLALIAILSIVVPIRFAFASFLGALSATLADKLASEFGTLSIALPRMVLSNEIVDPGTSGARSRLGTIWELLAGLFLGSLATFFAFYSREIATSWFLWIPVATISAISGSYFDSILGKLIQAKYLCPNCNSIVEKKIHCGEKTKLVKGKSWIDNQVVNFTASVFGGIVGLFSYLVLQYWIL